MEKTKWLTGEELKQLSDAELQAYADKHHIDLTTASSREDGEAAIELFTEEAVKREAKNAPRPPRAGASGRRSQKPEGDELTGEQIEAVQKVWAEFARSIPQPAMSSGSYELDKQQRKIATDHGVPDGDYRIVGADWILTFERGRFVAAGRGGPTTKADSYATVPATEHRVPG